MTDQLVAGVPRARRRNPLIRLFSSVWFGVSMLFLILVYACVASALPQVRGAVEMTEMEIFGHWFFAMLIGLFSFSLIVSTLTRVRWNVINAGAVMTHIGLLALGAGAFWYFQSKIEGDVLLRSPCIEIRTADGRSIRSARLPAVKGGTWTQNMPALGGRVHVEVLDASPMPHKSARVSVQLGDADPQTYDLSVAGKSVAKVGNRLQVALVTFAPERKFYEKDTAALYFQKVGSPDESWRIADLAGLPFHRERYLDEGYVVQDRSGRDIPSKRVEPAVSLGSVSIPTGWFEHWRMPIRVNAPNLPFDVEVTGYLPYVAGTRNSVVRGDSGNPAVELELRAGERSLRRWLLADDPIRSFMGDALPFEFYWIKSDAERQQLLRPLAGPHELTVELSDPPLKKTFVITQGQTIELEGTPYKLTIKQLSASWPLMTPGFEGARSPMVSVDVTNGEKSYNRTVIQRFPSLSQDIDEKGVRHRDGPYDPNLKLLYRTSAAGWGIVTAGASIDPVIGLFSPDGTVQQFSVSVGKAQPVTINGFEIQLTLRKLFEHGRVVSQPVVESIERRRPGYGRRLSYVRLKFTGRGDDAGWSQTQWVSFSTYPNIDAVPFRVDSPAGAWSVIYSRRENDLGAELFGDELSVTFFPGRRNPETWRSDFEAKEDGQAEARPVVVYTNHTATVGRWTYFQSSAATDHWSFTILGVGNRHGIWLMTLACILITLGCLYAFYLKPILIMKRSSRAIEVSEASAAAGPELDEKPTENPEFVEA